MLPTQRDWDTGTALDPIGATTTALGLGLQSLTRHPFSTRPVRVIATLAIPVSIAFNFSHDFSFDDTLNEIFARFLLIWLVHMSFIHFLVAPKDIDLCRKFLQKNNDHKEEASEISDKNGIRTTVDAAAERALSGWKTAYTFLFNARGIYTTWTVPTLVSEVDRLQREGETTSSAEIEKMGVTYPKRKAMSKHHFVFTPYH
jgi:hypothetical protein